MENYAPYQNTKLSRLDLWLIRLFISSACLAQRILFIITLVHLFQEAQLFTFTFMLLFHIFLVIFSIINILLNFHHQIKISRLQRLFWEFLYFLPDSDTQDKMIVDNSANMIIKLVFDVICNFILLINIIVLKQEKWSWIATQIVNTLMILIEFYIIESKHETFKKKISYIVTAFPLLVLLQGYIIINLRSLVIFFYIAFLFIFSLLLHLCKTFQSLRFKLQYEHEVVNPYKSFFKTFFWFLFQLSIYFKFRKNCHAGIFQRKYEVYNLFSATQIMQIFLLGYLDIRFNAQNSNETYRRILHVSLISLTFYITKVFKWFKKYMKEGPQCRNIELNCSKTLALSMEEVNKQYFNFNQKQQYMKVRFTRFDQQQFERIFDSLIKQEKSLSMYVQEENTSRRNLENFETYNFNKLVSIQLKSAEYTQSVLKIINQNLLKDYRYIIKICDNNIKYHVLYNILLNHQLIPNLVIHSQLFNPNIFFYVNEIRKIIVYNKYISEFMIHSPLQIYYDLFDY
ncbi:hypothetical protein ABPG74_009939 [Tetrahymena malaccensis]